MSYQENYQKWVDFAELPDYLRQDLENMDEKTKEDAFYTNLEFGTAGMRGLIGAGTNRINIYVVRQATEGLARLIESKGGNEKERGVAIAYDSRHFSPEFAFESAAVLAKHGINLMYLKAFVQLQNSHLRFVTSTVSQVLWSQPATTLLHLTVTRFTVKTVDKCLHTMRTR